MLGGNGNKSVKMNAGYKEETEEVEIDPHIENLQLILSSKKKIMWR